MHSHNHHFHWWKFFPKKEISKIYLAIAIRSFALSLVSLFVPIYLHVDLGFSLRSTLSFFIFYSVIFAIFTPLAAKFSSKFGLKHSILLSVPFQIIYLLLLYKLGTYNIPLALIATFLGLSMAFFWMGMHLEFKQTSHKKNLGEEVGKAQGIAVLSTLSGPLIGGLIISYFSFNVAFTVSAILLFFSALPLLVSGDKHVPYKFSIRNLVSKKYLSVSFFYTYRGAWVVASRVLWPLFIYLSLKSYLSLGLLGTISGIITALLMIFVGKRSDKIGKDKIIYWAVPFESFSWLIRGLFSTFNGFLGISLFQSLTYGVLSSPLTAKEYELAKDNSVEYFITREIYLCIGRILILSFVLLTGSFVASFWLVGFGSFLALLL